MKTKTLHLSVIVLSVVLIILLGIASVVTILTGTGWKSSNGGHYYLDDEGNRLYGWQELDGATYYFDPESGLLHTGWLELPDGKYFLNSNGNPIIGLFPCPQGSYYFDDDGRMVIGWADTDEGKRYFAKDGTMTVGFLELDGKQYCFDRSGILCTGWKDLQGQRFYFDKTGVMHTGWLEIADNKYYLNDEGHMHTGWMQTDEARYYFLPDGKMATGFLEVDGIARYFSSDGNYVPLVNPWNEVPQGFEPRLVDLEGEKMDSTCVDALQQLLKDVRDAGMRYSLNSSYRDIAEQTDLWDQRYNNYLNSGYSAEEALRLTARWVARPGTSEHHTGLAIDIGDPLGTGKLYEWFRQHAWEYGFVVRYRGAKESLTGIMDEPWHLRYVGKEVAQVLQENNWCLEEFMNQFSN